MIAPENAFSAMPSPMNSEADAIGATSNPPSPASALERTNAPIITAATLIPISEATAGLCATARIALPMRVRRITRSRVIITTTATASTSSSCGRTPTPANRSTRRRRTATAA